MYISPHEIAETRNHTLHNLLAASTACVDASGRLTSLFARAGRDAIAHGSRQLGKLASGTDLIAPAAFWLDSLQSGPVQLFEEALDILGDTHTAMIQAAEAQFRACDRLFLSAIDRTARSSPWEGELALAVMKTTLQSAESTVHNLADAAIQTVELAETQVRQVTDSLAEGHSAKPAPRPSRRKKAQ